MLQTNTRTRIRYQSYMFSLEAETASLHCLIGVRARVNLIGRIIHLSPSPTMYNSLDCSVGKKLSSRVFPQNVSVENYLVIPNSENDVEEFEMFSNNYQL